VINLRSVFYPIFVALALVPAQVRVKHDGER
jgi:hypothetical protein